MGHGNGHHHVKPTPASLSQLTAALDSARVSGEPKPPQTEEKAPKHPKEEAPLLFDKKTLETRAEERRSSLTTLLEGESGNSNGAGKSSGNSNARDRVPVSENLTSQPLERGKAVVQNQIERAENLVNKTWDDLIGAAKQHKDLENFRQMPREFWTEVREMSQLRTAETYVGGRLEPRAASRYGDLLALLDRFVGKDGSANGFRNFVNALPSGERQVFLARYQLHQTFGASDLFAGQRGVSLDRSGRFSLETFLSANGKNPQLSAATILSLFGGDAAASAAGDKAAAKLLADGGVFFASQLLLNPRSAALFGLGLALYQNINALLALDQLIPQEFAAQKPFGETAAAAPPPLPPQQSRLAAKNTFENSDAAANNAATKRAGENFAAGALINGALLTIENYRKAKRGALDLWADAGGRDDGFRFAAGATGAMMGATVGCVVPLAGRSVGEILGFASSVVVGLSDSGLRSLGANALVSVITSGVQTFLNVSGASSDALPDARESKFLRAANAAGDFYADEDLSGNLFASRADALLPV